VSIEPPFRSTDPKTGADRATSGSSARDHEMPDNMPRDPECPFCDGHDTEIMNACGSHASVSAYWCRPCGSPFEIMKWRG